MALPALVRNVSHKDLEIQEGATESLAWYRMVTAAATEADRERTYQHLLDYCRLDTLAMVEIFRYLQSNVSCGTSPHGDAN
jgi:hypothetical protein